MSKVEGHLAHKNPPPPVRPYMHLKEVLIGLALVIHLSQGSGVLPDWAVLYPIVIS
jgi:hypothetical protein